MGKKQYQEKKSSNNSNRIERKKIKNNYIPSEDEKFMNSRQLTYFKKRLLDWKSEIMTKNEETIYSLQAETTLEPDVSDRATTETNRTIELRTSDRQRKLLSKINAALIRIEEGTYGYCIETGEEISLKRLLARPIAILSIEAQERHEKLEKIYRDD